MFRIRPEHAEAFRRAATEDYVARATAHLRSNLTERVAPFSDAGLESRIRRAMDRAPNHGLISEKEVMGFLYAGLLLGEQFETDPRCPKTAAVLHDKSLDGPEKFVRLIDAAQDESAAIGGPG